MSSCHLLLGRPLDLFPLLGCHSVHRFVIMILIQILLILMPKTSTTTITTTTTKTATTTTATPVTVVVVVVAVAAAAAAAAVAAVAVSRRRRRNLTVLCAAYRSQPFPLCADIDECLQTETCPGDYDECVNTNGSYICRCDDGYERVMEDGPCVGQSCLSTLDYSLCVAGVFARLCVVGYLVGYLVVWLVGWSVGWLVDRLAGWLIGWLVGRQVCIRCWRGY